MKRTGVSRVLENVGEVPEVLEKSQSLVVKKQGSSPSFRPAENKQTSQRKTENNLPGALTNILNKKRAKSAKSPPKNAKIIKSPPAMRFTFSPQ